MTKPSYQRASSSATDLLMDAAKRYRADTEKIEKAVAEAFASKRKQRKAEVRKSEPEPAPTAVSANA